MTNSEAVIRFYKEGLGIDVTWEDFIKAYHGEAIFIVPIIEKAREYCRLKEEGYDVRVSIQHDK